MSQAPITRRKLYQEVQDRLLQRITAGEIRAGEQLPSERELMEFYGVGRVAVREALQELARSGIVEISHGERARVVVPTARLLIQQMGEGTRHLLRMQPEMLDHLKDARLFLEIGMVRQAALRATPDDVVALRERWQRHQEAMLDLEHFIEKVRSVAPLAFDVDAQQVWELVIELDFIDYQLSRLNGNWRSFVLVTPVKINPDGTVAHYPDAFEYVCPRQPVIYVDEQA